MILAVDKGVRRTASSSRYALHKPVSCSLEARVTACLEGVGCERSTVPPFASHWTHNAMVATEPVVGEIVLAVDVDTTPEYSSRATRDVCGFEKRTALPICGVVRGMALDLEVSYVNSSEVSFRTWVVDI